jgi:hypothetical protein
MNHKRRLDQTGDASKRHEESNLNTLEKKPISFCDLDNDVLQVICKFLGASNVFFASLAIKALYMMLCKENGGMRKKIDQKVVPFFFSHRQDQSRNWDNTSVQQSISDCVTGTYLFATEEGAVFKSISLFTYALNNHIPFMQPECKTNRVNGSLVTWESKFKYLMGKYADPEFVKFIALISFVKVDAEVTSGAASSGNLELIHYLASTNCAVNRDTFCNAALNGHLDVLKFLKTRISAYEFCDSKNTDGHTFTSDQDELNNCLAKAAFLGGYMHVIEWLQLPCSRFLQGVSKTGSQNVWIVESCGSFRKNDSCRTGFQGQYDFCVSHANFNLNGGSNCPPVIPETLNILPQYLFEAIAFGGDIRVYDLLVRAGHIFEDYEITTALLHASSCGHLDIFKFFYYGTYKKYESELRPGYGVTNILLMHSTFDNPIIYGHMNVLEFLIEKYIDQPQKKNLIVDLCYTAAKSNKLSALKFLWEKYIAQKKQELPRHICKWLIETAMDYENGFTSVHGFAFHWIPKHSLDMVVWLHSKVDFPAGMLRESDRLAMEKWVNDRYHGTQDYFVL